ncbi:MAG: TagK domain-containing protein [Zoogloeaceae bacterium]|jgi:hypothetical protein|nr:TagK domain-containing protein [Zoogloeaceae bacterium]
MKDEELCLRLLRQREADECTVLTLVASGMLSVPEEDVSVLGVPLSEAEGNILRQAKIAFQKDVTATPVRWRMRCHGQTWVCAVNDARVERGESLFIQPGDRVDIGLLRFMVVTAAETAALRQAADETPEDAKEAAAPFELSGLAADTPEWKTTGVESNPFDIVGVHVPYLDDAQPALDLLKDSNLAPSSDAPAPEKDVLARLADEYARVIMNPDLLHQQHWEAMPQEQEEQRISSLDVLRYGQDEQDKQEWGADQSLEDFVAGKLTIQDILNRFGIDDFQALEAPEPCADVLTLFAQGLSRKPIERIPARTRGDHHRVSLDSHYQPEESAGNLVDAPKDTDS